MMAQDRPRRILTGEYVMEGHSQCPWCENHIKIKDDPAGGCHEEVAIFAYFEHSMWDIEADDFLKGRESAKPLRNNSRAYRTGCPFYKFNPEASP